MSDGRREPIYGGDDRRTGDAPHEHEAVYDFFVDLIGAGSHRSPSSPRPRSGSSP